MGIISKKIINHGGVKLQQIIQENGDGYSRWFLPPDGNRNSALKVNDYLTKKEVELILKEKKNEG